MVAKSVTLTVVYLVVMLDKILAETRVDDLVELKDF